MEVSIATAASDQEGHGVRCKDGGVVGCLGVAPGRG